MLIEHNGHGLYCQYSMDEVFTCAFIKLSTNYAEDERDKLYYRDRDVFYKTSFYESFESHFRKGELSNPLFRNFWPYLKVADRDENDFNKLFMFHSRLTGKEFNILNYNEEAERLRNKQRIDFYGNRYFKNVAKEVRELEVNILLKVGSLFEELAILIKKHKRNLTLFPLIPFTYLLRNCTRQQELSFSFGNKWKINCNGLYFYEDNPNINEVNEKIETLYSIKDKEFQTKIEKVIGFTKFSKCYEKYESIMQKVKSL